MSHNGKMRGRHKTQKSGKWRNIFLRCVRKTGKWRGKPASINDVKNNSSSLFNPII